MTAATEFTIRRGGYSIFTPPGSRARMGFTPSPSLPGQKQAQFKNVNREQHTHNRAEDETGSLCSTQVKDMPRNSPKTSEKPLYYPSITVGTKQKVCMYFTPTSI